MTNLENVIKDYLKHESIINASTETEKSLRHKMEQVLGDNNHGVYFVEGAEQVYKANEAVLNHLADIEKHKIAKQKAGDVILKHLELLDSKPLQYIDRGTEPHYYTTTYNFAIKDGEVIHNHTKER